MQGGGAERVTLNLINALVKRGYRVDLVLAQLDGPYMKLVDSRVNIIDLQVKLGGGGFARSITPLAKYLLASRPARLVPVAHEANLVGIFASLLCGYRDVYVTEHIDLTTSLKGFRRPKQVLLRQVTRMLYRVPRKIVAVSRGVADDLTSSFGVSPSRLVVVTNPVLTEAQPAVGVGERRGLLAAGRMTPQKDFATLLDAFHVVRARRDVSLTILGEGPLMNDLRSRAHMLGLETHIEFPGFVDDPEAYYDRARVFVMSSVREGLPTVLIEALGRGMSIVSTDCPSGPREILAGGRFGRLVPVGDAHALAQAIEQALDEPFALPENLAAHLQQFTVEHAVEQYIRVLDLSPSGGRGVRDD